MEQEVLKKARNFVYRNARPLDLARWEFHFEGGSPDRVLECLSAYQNEDGGFGHALEPDCWNPNSNPIAVWAAAQRLREIGHGDGDHPVVRGILRYLDSGKDFAEGKWFNTVPSSNDYPHAVWWTCEGGTGLPDNNPTVSLAGFILRFAAKDSSLYQKGRQLAVQVLDGFMAEPEKEMHTLRCFLDLLCWCEETPGFDAFDLGGFRARLYEAISLVVCREPEKWYTEYVCKPSFFFEQSCRLFEIIGRGLLEAEGRMILEQQLEDGSYPITWNWWTEYQEAEISANWWKSSIIVDNLRYIKALEEHQ